MNQIIRKFDFIIIGSGLAGLYSAMHASRFGKVAVITKSSIEESSSYWAQGGIAAVMDRGDSIDDHLNDTLSAGKGLCSEQNVRILVKEGQIRIQELIALGMKFDSSDNQLLMGLEGGHTKRRILHAGGSETGKKVVQFVINEIIGNKNIEIFENTFVFQLISDQKKCSGVKAYNWVSKKTEYFLSPATILASGGLSGIFSRSTNPHVSTGDGIALAYMAGAELSDLEFIQFHPTAFYSESGKTFLVSEAVRGEGAFLLNEKSERFLLKIDERAELAPRDIVAKAIYEEIKKQNKKFVYLNTEKIDAQYFQNRFPNIYKNALELGYKLPNDMLPVAPAAHYTIGGVRTDSNSKTNIQGLFACGETAANGIHGANRLASNSLLECLVYGKRAVDSALEIKADDINSDVNEESFKVEEQNENKFIKTRNIIAAALNDNAGILRDGEFLEKAILNLNSIEQSEPPGENEYYSVKTKFLITLAQIIFRFAIERKESRGCHSRIDYPAQSDKFKSHFVISNKSKIKQINLNA